MADRRAALGGRLEGTTITGHPHRSGSHKRTAVTTGAKGCSGKTAMPGQRQDHRWQSHHLENDHPNLRGGLRLRHLAIDAL
jgi:hypothetical protein